MLNSKTNEQRTTHIMQATPTCCRASSASATSPTLSLSTALTHAPPVVAPRKHLFVCHVASPTGSSHSSGAASPGGLLGAATHADTATDAEAQDR